MSGAYIMQADSLQDAKDKISDFLDAYSDGQALFFEYDQLKIQYARVLGEKLYQSSEGRSLFVVFASFLPELSQNVLLKSIEEMSEKNLLFLATLQPDFLLDTLRSRLEPFDAQRSEKDFDLSEFISKNPQDKMRFLEKLHKKSLQDELAFLRALESLTSDKIKRQEARASDLRKILLYKKALLENLQPIKPLRESLAFIEL